MKLRQAALDLIAKGNHVFPLIPNSKLPAIADYVNQATTDPKQVNLWWQERPYNIGISTTRYNGSQALVVVDVDNKGAKNGDQEFVRLQLDGYDFIETATQKTPTGGRHLIYRSNEPVKQGTDVLAKGLDIRSRGGYIVGPGSVIDGKTYEWTKDIELAECPDWIIEKCGKPPESNGNGHKTPIEADRTMALARAINYLQLAPIARDGDGGDQTTYRVAARVKDFGLDSVDALDILFTHWNPRCEPPWSSEELATKVANAYRYGNNPQGADSPEAHFLPITHPGDQKIDKESHPVGELNKHFSFLTKNSEIIWKTVDYKGHDDLVYLTISEFTNHMLSKRFIDGNGKSHQISNLWLRSENRKSYVATCFAPGRNVPPQFYNLWTGFSVGEPKGILPDEAHSALRNLLHHIKVNICDGVEDHFNWFVGYFAHLIQKPHIKPRTSVVMKGRKGTGKNVFTNCISRLIRANARTVSNRRYLTGNFNSHLERLLLFVLDEAFWSGDKASEGILKDLITGDTHQIERKGRESYTIDNLTRVVILGNENWVVPASEDERRFAVFNVGDGNRMDVKFFQGILDGMDLGGDQLLFQYLKNFDLTNFQVNLPPETKGLLEQKTESLEPFYQWWLEGLETGKIIFAESHWPNEIDCIQFRDGYQRYIGERNIRGRLPAATTVGKMIKSICPSIKRRQKRTGVDLNWVYDVPTIEVAREEWEKFIGHKINWDELQ